MEHQEFLRTISEVAITLTGFIGIVVALKFGSSDWSSRTIMQFSALLRASIAASLLSFVPYLLFQATGLEELSWRLSAALLASVMALNIALFVRDTKGNKLTGIQGVMFIGGFLMLTVVILSVFKVLDSSTVFLFGVVWQITVGVNNFALLLISDIRNPEQIRKIQS
jgi:hypothetical protein